MKKFLTWLAVAAAVMLLLPALSVAFVPGDAGMFVCFFLFFFIDPMCALVVGVQAGKDIQMRWSLPLLTAVLFVVGAWLFFAWGETSFFLYAAVYLGLGLVAMLVSMLLTKRSE